MASGSELTELLVTSLDAEASDVNESRNEVRVDNVGGQNLDEVLRHKGPDGELGALSSGSGGEDRKSESARVQG